jgi:hypothetical protein
MKYSTDIQNIITLKQYQGNAKVQLKYSKQFLRYLGVFLAKLQQKVRGKDRNDRKTRKKASAATG